MKSFFDPKAMFSGVIGGVVVIMCATFVYWWVGAKTFWEVWGANAGWAAAVGALIAAAWTVAWLKKHRDEMQLQLAEMRRQVLFSEYSTTNEIIKQKYKHIAVIREKYSELGMLNVLALNANEVVKSRTDNEFEFHVGVFISVFLKSRSFVRVGVSDLWEALNGENTNFLSEHFNVFTNYLNKFTSVFGDDPNEHFEYFRRKKDGVSEAKKTIFDILHANKDGHFKAYNKTENYKRLEKSIELAKSILNDREIELRAQINFLETRNGNIARMLFNEIHQSPLNKSLKSLPDDELTTETG